MANQQNINGRIDDYEKEMHLQNQKKIRIGLRLLLGIPLVFLFLLFITDSNKIVFLVLWITSLFLIASYLIIIEYEDYKLQKSLNAIRGDDDAEVQSLIDLDSINEKMGSAVENAKEHFEAREEKREEKREEIREGIKEFREEQEERREVRKENREERREVREEKIEALKENFEERREERSGKLEALKENFAGRKGKTNENMPMQNAAGEDLNDSQEDGNQ